MPIYEYVCQSCGEPLEKLQKLADAPLTDCPSCGEVALRRKVSAAGFRLSGGGWYETDFKSDGKRNLANNSEASAGQSSASDASSSSQSGDSASTGGSSSKAGSEGKSSSSSTTSSSKTGD